MAGYENTRRATEARHARGLDRAVSTGRETHVGKQACGSARWTRSAPRRASKSSSAATLTARRCTTIAMASERCVCARASTICARVSGETRCTSSNQRAHRRQKSAPLDPDVPHECPKLVLNPRGSQRRASRRLPPFQQSWLSERLRPTRSRERPRGSLERCWPCFHTTWRSAGHAVRVGSLEFAKSEVVGKKKARPTLRRCVAATGTSGGPAPKSRGVSFS